MEIVPPTARLVKFGVFEVDLRTGELRKGGLKLKFAGQPFQVLALLMERPGDVVTREELQKRLWPEGTFVDFDHNLNAAINKIREVLGDSAENPRFIETLPRRGYRFIYPVAEPSGLPATGTAMDASRQESPVRTPALQPARAASPRHRHAFALGLAAFILALAIAYVLRPTLPPLQVLNSMRITNDGRPKLGIATDGTRLYFGATTGGVNKLYQVSTVGGTTAQIDSTVENPYLLDISPDHTQLLVLRAASYLPDRPLYAVPVLGGSPHSLNRLSVVDAAWSPEGRQLVYSQGNGLYLASADGTASRKLVTVGGVASRPQWSPDGKMIRFSITSEMVAGTSIWGISADGKGLHQLLVGWNNPPSECCGTWTADGKYFFFSSAKGGTRNIWAIREGGSPFYKVNHQPVRSPRDRWARFHPFQASTAKSCSPSLYSLEGNWCITTRGAANSCLT